MRIKDLPLTEFIARYALMISSKHTLQYALLLADGIHPARAQSLALNNNQVWIDAAHFELERLGFIEVKP